MTTPRAKIPDFDARCLSILELLSCNRSSLLFFFTLLSDFCFFHQKNRRSCIARVNPNRGFLIFVFRSRFRFSKRRKFEWFARNFVTEMKIRNRTCVLRKKSFKIRHVVNRSRRYQMSSYSILKRSTCLFL